MIFFGLFWAQLWIGFVSCAVYHIVPSPDHHCPVESCLTLSSFAANASHYLDNNTSLIFQPGNHIIRSKLNVTDVVNFSMISDQSRADITCENDSKAEFIFNGVNHVHVNNLKFYECHCDNYDDYDYLSYDINMITLTASSLVLVKCTFEDNVGLAMINAENSNITIEHSIVKNNQILLRRSYTHIIEVDISNLLIYDTIFIGNKANIILHIKESVVSTVNSTFKHNHGSVMDMTNCKMDIHNSVFNDNGYGVLNLRYSKIQIYGSEFKGNVGITGGAINCFGESLISFSEICTFTDNQAIRGGAVYLNYKAQCLVDQGASVIIANNTALQKGGGIYLETLTSLTLHSQSMLQIVENTASRNGGGIYSNCDCNLTLHSQSTLQILENRASVDGGGIYLNHDYKLNLILHSQCTLQILENTALKDGGGIYLGPSSNITLHSQSTLQIIKNRATNAGGGIYASHFSSINLWFTNGQTSNSTIYFNRNQARIGGGLYLEFNSIVYIFPCLNNIINFDKNSADYGGAMYVVTKNDDDGDDYYSDPECFFQSDILQNPTHYNNISDDTIECNKKPFHFSLNRANYSGFTLYKEAFNNCSIDGTSFDEFKLLSILSNIHTSDIGSSWVQLCYCENGFPDCSRQIPYINIKPGEKLIIEVAIVDRRNHAVSGFIKSEISGSVQIRDDQKIQAVVYGCTSLSFNIIYSFEASQQLIMSPLIKNRIYRVSEKSIKINFLACINCPVGFLQIKDYDNTRGCDCVCDAMKLGSHIITCNYTRETITKKGTTAWITYLSVKNTSDYLIYPYCPMDYCLPPDVATEINLNTANGADAQCAHNRSGLLCGTCNPGLSLSLGSSRCLPCFTHWPGVFVVIITSSLLAGILLVASLLMLNLTVAAGTINGLIFWANIVAANQYKFFPSTSFVTMFVSWFNLELGIDTCFFDGMDFYWKTWIQLTFPAYILLLVVLVIVFSECSVKFAQIVSKRNPIATLDTLILLCYVKFLRTVIVAFSFATLDYPDGSHPVVWWSDATVGYFSGKHIVLWVTSAIIFLVG